MSEERKKEDIVKCINGELYYLGDYANFLYEELERLNSIIKEVREYIKSNEFIGRIRLSSDNKQAINKLLEILDKVEENNND